MASRKGAIIELAEQASELLIEALPPERAVAKTNYRNIAAVCRALLNKPRGGWMPTAELVADVGKGAVPAARTIHNIYADMMRIWKRAHHDINNMLSNDPIALDELPLVDLTGANANTKHAFDELHRHLREAHQRNNALKKLITDSVPVDADHLGTTSGRAIESLAWWLNQLHSGLFTLDEDGLKVSRKTPIGTTIVDADILNDLKILVDDFTSTRKHHGIGKRA